MEAENADDIKTILLKQSEQHREGLEQEVRALSDRTEKFLTNALIIGGTLAASYLVVRMITRSRSPKSEKSEKSSLKKKSLLASTYGAEESEEAPGIFSQVGTALASQAAIFLLGIAKQKLADYIQSAFSEKPVENNERPTNTD